MKSVNSSQNLITIKKRWSIQYCKQELFSPRGGLLSAGILILIAVAYLDNVRGPLLPVISQELGIPYTYAGFFLAIGNLAAVISMFILGRLMQKYNDRKVTVAICLFAVTSGLLAPFISSMPGLLLLGIIMGSSVAMLGAISNILTIKGSPVHLRGRILSGQQVMYGVGSFLAPFAFTQLMQLHMPWWSVIAIASLFFCSLALLFRRSIPVEPPQTTTETQSHNLQGQRFIATMAVLAFGFYVGGEVLASMWMSTFMVNQLNLSPEQAANYVGGFFIFLAGSRVLSFFLVRARYETFILVTCVIVGILALLAAQQGHAWAFPLVGLLGPFYPLFMAEISRSFAQTWKSLTIWVFVAIQTTLGLIHITVGHITDLIGIKQAFLIAPGLLLACLFHLFLFFKMRPRSSS